MEKNYPITRERNIDDFFQPLLKRKMTVENIDVGDEFLQDILNVCSGKVKMHVDLAASDTLGFSPKSSLKNDEKHVVSASKDTLGFSPKLDSLHSPKNVTVEDVNGEENSDCGEEDGVYDEDEIDELLDECRKTISELEAEEEMAQQEGCVVCQERDED